MIDRIDNILNRITMYRLVLYYLMFLLGVAIALSFAGVLRYDPYALLVTVAFLIAVCSVTNWIFARVWHIPANAESTFITALILALIITPLQTPGDLWFYGWAGVWAMASKYIIAIDKKHIFNPAAFAVALTYLAISQAASWWVGSAPMLPFVLLGGILLVRKLGRADLVNSYLLTLLATTVVLSFFNGSDLFATLQSLLLYSPMFFFAFVILTEPLTTPPSQGLRILYGAGVGLLSSPQFHLGGLYLTPEIAILIGNGFSYLVSPKRILVLRLVQKAQLAPDIYDLTFAPKTKLSFAPGQYLEWTLGHSDPDSRGNRRFFTLASAPTEDNLKLGIRVYPHSSTFKQAMLSMTPDTEIVASNLGGDFVLPRNPKQKLVFIAGGIGITPFRSMIKYLVDIHQPRPIVLFYANRSINDFVYIDVFEKARKELGIQTIYTVTDPRNTPITWQGRTGRISAKMIKAQVPDYRKCIFYISGPKNMLDSFKELLAELRVPESHIKTDYFSGLA